MPPPVPWSVVKVTSAAVTCDVAFIARIDPPLELMETDSERKLPDGTAVAETVPTLTSPLAFKTTEETVLVEVADTEVAFSAVLELIVMEDPKGLVADAVSLDALSTVAQIPPLLDVNETGPAGSMSPLVMEVPESETFPLPALMPKSPTELPVEVMDTGPPVVAISAGI